MVKIFSLQVICCIESIGDLDIHWAEWVGAIATLILAYAAITELGHISKFIKEYTVSATNNEKLNQIQINNNAFNRQIELHYTLIERMISIISMAKAFDKDIEIFKYLYFDLADIYNVSDPNKNEIDRIADSFNQLYGKYGHAFGSYYKNLYNLLSYIDNIHTEDPQYNKAYYVNTLKAQLSKYEILLLAYDCIWIQDKRPPQKNFIDYARQYELLTALETDELLNNGHIALFRDKYNIDLE